MLHQVLPCGVKVKYLDPSDCAVSKYARSEPKDREWIRAGIEAGIVSLPAIEYRMRETRFMDDGEHDMAKASVAEERLCFRALRGGRGGLLWTAALLAQKRLMSSQSQKRISVSDASR